MPFSQKSLDFLFENRLNDSREWYNANKHIYKEYVTKPFTELLNALAPMFEEIDPRLVCAPRCICRVNRDCRFSKDKSLYRDHIWFSVKPPKCERPLPEFYFCIEQGGFSYGSGYYCMPKETMDELREMILSGNKLYTAAKESLKEQDVFVLGGEMYKRNHFPDQSEEDCCWLNRKSLHVSAFSTDKELLFSDRLVDKLKEDFPKLAPFYKFVCAADAIAAEKKFHHF